MSIDPAQIELTPEQKERLARLAERSGKEYSEVLDELLAGAGAPRAENGATRAPTSPRQGAVPRTAYDAFAALGAIGCFEGPTDLSTNPQHMKGFGINASRRAADAD